MKKAVAAAGVAAGGGLTFVASVARWGPWWRLEDAPTAEEWSAFFGAFVVVGLLFAWFQVRQVDRSNRVLAESNRETQRVNLELVRPRLLVDLQFTRSVFRSRQAEVKGSIQVVVRNLAANPARDVRLEVSPPFTSLPIFFKPGKMERHFETMNGRFDGSIAFEHLAPDTQHGHYLGGFPDLIADTSGAPRRYVVTATYTDMTGQHSFSDRFVLDLDTSRTIDITGDPLIRLGKDVEVVGDELKTIRRTLVSWAAQSQDGDDDDPRPYPRPRPSHAQRRRRRPPQRR